LLSRTLLVAQITTPNPNREAKDPKCCHITSLLVDSKWLENATKTNSQSRTKYRPPILLESTFNMQPYSPVPVPVGNTISTNQIDSALKPYFLQSQVLGVMFFNVIRLFEVENLSMREYVVVKKIQSGEMVGCSYKELVNGLESPLHRLVCPQELTAKEMKAIDNRLTRVTIISNLRYNPIKAVKVKSLDRLPSKILMQSVLFNTGEPGISMPLNRKIDDAIIRTKQIATSNRDLNSDLRRLACKIAPGAFYICESLYVHIVRFYIEPSKVQLN